MRDILNGYFNPTAEELEKHQREFLAELTLDDVINTIQQIKDIEWNILN